MEGSLSILGVMRVIDAERPIPFVQMLADRERRVTVGHLGGRCANPGPASANPAR